MQLLSRFCQVGGNSYGIMQRGNQKSLVYRRYELVISNLNLKECVDKPNIKTYFNFLMNDNKLFLLDDIDLK